MTILVKFLANKLAVAVLAGALLVGDSVRASLRDLFQQRLGNTDQVILAQRVKSLREVEAMQEQLMAEQP